MEGAAFVWRPSSRSRVCYLRCVAGEDPPRPLRGRWCEPQSHFLILKDPEARYEVPVLESPLPIECSRAIRQAPRHLRGCYSALHVQPYLVTHRIVHSATMCTGSFVRDVPTCWWRDQFLSPAEESIVGPGGLSQNFALSGTQQLHRQPPSCHRMGTI